MHSRCDYKTLDSKERLNGRSFVRVPVRNNIEPAQGGTRIFVPFSGFTGQQLAGTGALVFEGELLQETRH